MFPYSFARPSFPPDPFWTTLAQVPSLSSVSSLEHLTTHLAPWLETFSGMCSRGPERGPPETTIRRAGKAAQTTSLVPSPFPLVTGPQLSSRGERKWERRWENWVGSHLAGLGLMWSWNNTFHWGEAEGCSLTREWWHSYSFSAIYGSNFSVSLGFPVSSIIKLHIT